MVVTERWRKRGLAVLDQSLVLAGCTDTRGALERVTDARVADDAVAPDGPPTDSSADARLLPEATLPDVGTSPPIAGDVSMPRADAATAVDLSSLVAVADDRLPDGAATTDAIPPVDGAPSLDALAADAVQPGDLGPPPDAAPPPPDAAPPTPDVALSPEDAALPDAAVLPEDAALPDAALPPEDAALPDAALPPEDAAPPVPDADPYPWCHGEPSLPMLDHLVLDAEYSTRLERIVTVEASPHRLHVIDPETGEDQVLDLPATPRAVAVAPDGLQAVVGHDASVTFVDLETLSQTANVPVPLDVFDVVLRDDGLAIASPRVRGSFSAIERATGRVQSTADRYSANTSLALHPDGSRLYGGFGNFGLGRLEVVDGLPQQLRSGVPLSVCGKVRIDGGGERAMTDCLSTYRLTPAPQTDMAYGCAFLMSSVRFAAAVDMPALGVIAGLFADSGQPAVTQADRLFFFRGDNLEAAGERPLPCVGGDAHARSHGRFLYRRGDSAALYALLAPNADTGLAGDAAIARFALPEAVPVLPSPPPAPPTAAPLPGDEPPPDPLQFPACHGLRPVSMLWHTVVGAGYSPALDAVITVEAAPHRLHVIDPETLVDHVVELPNRPRGLAVSPDGRRAAVGADAFVTFVDLEAGEVQSTVPAPVVASELVLTNDGVAVGSYAGSQGL